ncbi:MAG: hypothetical protein GC159_17745 [Phycisphaera sp.]|nr:hypothetical protein [Phycisphaera sp.]
MSSRVTRGLVAIVMFLALTGCGQHLKERELQDVAKDWCMTIRASQVIPVYPLSEDVQPGDVFVVATPISEQARLYREKGFLPLDQLVTRLGNLDYPGFYGDSYWLGTYAAVPHERPRRNGNEPVIQASAPRVAFPSYTFEVQSGVGMKLAVPVNGVPVGLGLMQADRATGSITISDASTYGIDSEGLLRHLHEWAERPEVREKLAETATVHNRTLFLRVVSRVYLTSSVVVSLVNQDSASGALDVGKKQDVTVLDLKDKAAAAAYVESIKTLSAALNEALPGGSLRVAQASSRSITMRESFDRPLVLGYLGLDVPVRHNGDLGPPVATQATLLSAVSGPVVVGELTRSQKDYSLRKQVLLRLAKIKPQQASSIALEMAGVLPKDQFGRYVGMAPQQWTADTFDEFIETLDAYVGNDPTGHRTEKVIRVYDAAFERSRGNG